MKPHQKSPAPGGGSISAYCSTLAASLTTMVANLSSHKRGWDDRWGVLFQTGLKGLDVQNELIVLLTKTQMLSTKLLNQSDYPKTLKRNKREMRLYPRLQKMQFLFLYLSWKKPMIA